MAWSNLGTTILTASMTQLQNNSVGETFKFTMNASQSDINNGLILSNVSMFFAYSDAQSERFYVPYSNIPTLYTFLFPAGYANRSVYLALADKRRNALPLSSFVSLSVTIDEFIAPIDSVSIAQIQGDLITIESKIDSIISAIGI